MGSEIGWVGTGVEILIISFLLYRTLLTIKGTRAVPMLIGLVAIILAYALTQEGYLHLPTVHWLLDQFISNLLLIVVVVFQADIRRTLTAFGRTQFLTQFRTGAEAQAVDELVKLCGALAAQHIGALVVVEREADLTPYLADAVRVDAKVSKELLYSIFVPERQNPLHDGAVVVREGRVEAAGVFLPMSVNPHLDRALGTRHRAALGLSEETDALILVVSEERGATSLAIEGVLERDLSLAVLRERLMDLLIKRPSRLFRRDRSVVTLLHRDRDRGGEDAPPAP